MMIARATVAIGLAMTLGTASADTILFNNLGEGDTYHETTGTGIGFDNNWQSGPGFVVNAGGSYYLTSIAAAILWHPPAANEVTLSVYDDDGGIPGNLLEATTLIDVLPDFTGWTEPPTDFNFSGTTILTGGETYWVIASAPTGTELVWHWNMTDDIGLFAQRQGEGPWQSFDHVRGAMRVTGTLVPAPGAVALLALASIAGRRGRSRN